MGKGPEAEKDGADGATGPKRNKQRVLILSSRGVTYRYGDTHAQGIDIFMC